MKYEWAVNGNWINAPRGRAFKSLSQAKDYAERLYVECLPGIGVMDHKSIIKSTCAECGVRTMFYCYDVYGFHEVRGHCCCGDQYIPG